MKNPQQYFFIFFILYEIYILQKVHENQSHKSKQLHSKFEVDISKKKKKLSWRFKHSTRLNLLPINFQYIIFDCKQYKCNFQFFMYLFIIYVFIFYFFIYLTFLHHVHKASSKN